MRKMFSLIRRFIPPIVMDFLSLVIRRFYHYGWYGDFKTWEEARQHTTGYDAEEILIKVKDALLAVKEGRAVHERDSVLFDRIVYSWPALSGLLLAASVNCGRLRVLDFGGSLGSTYFQNRRFLSHLKEVSWNIVEQPHFVETGKRYFSDERLHFYKSVDECLQHETLNVLVLSSVLQYIESPYELLDMLLSKGIEFVVVDRTPFHKKPYDRISVQRVPSWIYNASYPSWLFHKEKMLAFFQSKGYEIIEVFEDVVDGEGPDYIFEGFIARKK